MSKETIEHMTNSAIEQAQSKKKDSAGQNGKAKRGKAKRAFPFKVDETGVYRKDSKETESGSMRTVWTRFGSELHVEALTRSDEGEDWGKALVVVDRDGKRHEWAMPNTFLAGSGETLRAELFRLGFELEPTRQAKTWLLEYLISAEPDARARCVSRIGWHGDSFILPDGQVGGDETAEKVILQSSENIDHPFNCAGSLEDWKKAVATPAQGNSRLIFALSVAFAGPLLKLAGDESGGFHFRGASSSGKSTALTIAGSVWGGGGTAGYVRQWRATENGLESVVALFSDTVPCFDELSQLDAKAAVQAAYMLANGKGKARAGLSGQARKVQTWRVLFLSNGEIGLADKIREGGGKMAAGMEVRMPDIRADAGAGMGIFENIHNAASPADFAQDFKRAAHTYYGTAGRAFVAGLLDDLPGMRDKLNTLRKEVAASMVPDGADGQVRRVADRFALVAVAGEIASGMGLTGWPAGDASDAARRCFHDWIAERGGYGSGELAEAKRRIQEAIEEHGKSRFQRWHGSNSDRMVVANRMGFVKIEGNADVEEQDVTYYLLPKPFRGILAGLDFRAIVSDLHAAGVIVDQKGNPNWPNRVPSDGGQSHRLYQLDYDTLIAAGGE